MGDQCIVRGIDGNQCTVRGIDDGSVYSERN